MYSANRMRTQTTFSRAVDNAIKMGAYYTDIEHCADIGKMFLFPENKEVCVLEPSIGDARAVLEVTGAVDRPLVKIFGVEINKDVAEQVKENPHIEECLEADFLSGVRIKNNAFTFCFGNPPYMDDELDEGGKDRMEKQFLEKVTHYLAKEGLLCWVIPYKSFIDSSNMRFTMNHYDILAVYRFRESEYKKYHQIVMVARKRECRQVLRQEVESELLKYPLESIPVLSSEPKELFEVYPSEADKVTLFSKKEFDATAAYERLCDMDSDSAFDDLNNYLNRALTQEQYQVNELGKPPIPLKKDSLYLLATSGSGQGLTGSEETRDLHLQRGVAEVIEESEYITDAEGNVTGEKVISRTKVTMTVIEQSGKISVLE